MKFTRMEIYCESFVLFSFEKFVEQGKQFLQIYNSGAAHSLLRVICYYRDNTSGSFTHIGTDMDVSGNHESVLIFVPNTIIKARIFQLKLTSVIQLNSDKFSITDISIEYRKLRDRSIGDASSE